MKPFAYAAPASLEEALALLGQTWGETEVLAGGTDLITSLKQGLLAPKRIVSLKNIPALRGIRVAGETLHIGAMTPLAELAADASVRQHFPALVAAANNIGSPQILSFGTAGGDLCQRPRCWYYRNGFGLLAKQGDVSLVRQGDNRYHAIFGNEGDALFVSPSSLGPALIALDATLTAIGPKSKSREIPAAKFFQIPKNEQQRETVLAPNEILAEITVPIRGLKNATYEVRHRRGLDWPYVAAAIAYQDRNGAAQDARIVLGQVAPMPWVAGQAAQSLNGARVDAALAARCGEAAAQGAQPLGRNAYKIQLVKAAVKRAILAAAGISQEPRL